MGSFDGAEVCELIGLFILNSLAKKYGKDRVGLYRDDGLILLRGTSARLADKATILDKNLETIPANITKLLNIEKTNFVSPSPPVQCCEQRRNNFW
jgi:hypothetical protein